MSKLTQTKRGGLGQQTIARSGRIDNRSSSSEVMVSAQSTRVQGLHIKRNLTGITVHKKVYRQEIGLGFETHGLSQTMKTAE